jgi:hypothetical protein
MKKGPLLVVPDLALALLMVAYLWVFTNLKRPARHAMLGPLFFLTIYLFFVIGELRYDRGVKMLAMRVAFAGLLLLPALLVIAYVNWAR